MRGPLLLAVLLTASVSMNAQMSGPERQIDWALPDGSRVSLMDNMQQLLIVDVTRPSVGPIGRDSLQAWLLRKDGRTVAQQSSGRASWHFSDGRNVPSTAFTFDYVPFSEIVGVVVDINGTLFVRQLPPRAEPTERSTPVTSGVLVF